MTNYLMSRPNYLTCICSSWLICEIEIMSPSVLQSNTGSEDQTRAFTYSENIYVEPTMYHVQRWPLGVPW